MLKMTALFLMAVIFSLPLGSCAAEFAILVDAAEPENGPVVRALRALSDGHKAMLYRMSQAVVENPIEKGLLLARLSKAELVVPVRGAAAEFAARELEKVPIFFVGATGPPGPHLSSPYVGGILAYNPDAILAALQALGRRKIGILYTPGYESVMARVRRFAQIRNLRIVEKKISRRPEAAGAIRSFMGEVQAVWILGDPLISRGAVFEFLIENSFSTDTVVIGGGSIEVEEGALFCWEPDAKGLAEQAASSVRNILLAGGRFSDPRINFSTEEGGLLINSLLLRRWELHIPSGIRWRPLH